MTDLTALVDKAAITELIYRYCRAVDRLDVPLGHSIWHEGGTADYGHTYRGPGPGVIDLICQKHLLTLHHSHQISNILIALDGDRAGSESYCFATLRIDREGQLMQTCVWNRYVDRWERREGRWGLVHRQTIVDFDEIGPVREMKRHTHGTRDADDPSYGVLATP